MPDSSFPQGRVLFRFKTRPEDNVTGHDDMAAEYVVIEYPQAHAGLVEFGKHPRTGEWIANWGARHIVKRLLELNAGLLAEAKKLLALIDDVPIDAKLGDETDRVFPRWEFEGLREAVGKAEGKENP